MPFEWPPGGLHVLCIVHNCMWATLPFGDGVFFWLMNAGLPSHRDAFNVSLIDAEVGAADGDGDASQHGAEKRADLDVEMQ